MSDPFAHLLDSLKQDGKQKESSVSKEVPVKQTSNTPQALLNDWMPLVNSSKDTTPQPLQSKSNNSTDADWDKAFDIFNSTSATPTPAPAPITSEQLDVSLPQEQEHEQEQEQVVDEVGDMEIAQIMSLGIDYDQAIQYYHQGLNMNDILQARKQKNRTRDQNRPEHPPIHNNPSLGNTLLDVFNKSKNIVQSWTQFDSMENDRLRNSYNNISYEEQIADDLDQLSLRHSSSPSPPPPPPLIPPSASVSPPPPQSSQPPPSKQDLLLDLDQPPTSNINSTTMTPQPQISDIELISYNEFKNNATQQFKKGHYAEALEQYIKSLNTLPSNHPLRLIALSNMTISQLKIGEYNNIIKSTKSCESLWPISNSDDNNNNSNNPRWNAIIPQSDPQRTFKDIWIKIMLRMAEAYEHLEDYSNAKITYQSLLDKNVTTNKVLDGKRRCDKILNPKKHAPTKTSTSNTPTPSIQRNKNTTATAATTTTSANPQNMENVNRVKQQNAKLEEEANLKVKLYDQVELKINQWKADKPGDIRHLLADLPQVLQWTSWNPVSAADLVMPKKVKITYMKAVAKTHPDKIPANLDLENKMIAENVFATLSDAWEKFKQENNIV